MSSGFLGGLFGKKDKNSPQPPAPPAPKPIPSSSPASKLQPGLSPVPARTSVGAATTQPMVLPKSGGLKPAKPALISGGKSTQRIVLPGRSGDISAAPAALPSGNLGLPLGMIVRLLPDSVRAISMEQFEAMPEADQDVSLPLHLILPQLPSGKVEISIQELVAAIPRTYVRPQEEIAPFLSTLVSMPLMDVVMRIPPDLLALRPDQKEVDAAVVNMADPFTEELLREQAEAARKAEAEKQQAAAPAPAAPSQPVTPPVPVQDDAKSAGMPTVPLPRPVPGKPPVVPSFPPPAPAKISAVGPRPPSISLPRPPMRPPTPSASVAPTTPPPAPPVAAIEAEPAEPLDKEDAGGLSDEMKKLLAAAEAELGEDKTPEKIEAVAPPAPEPTPEPTPAPEEPVVEPVVEKTEAAVLPPPPIPAPASLPPRPPAPMAPPLPPTPRPVTATIPPPPPPASPLPPPPPSIPRPISAPAAAPVAVVPTPSPVAPPPPPAFPKAMTTPPPPPPMVPKPSSLPPPPPLTVPPPPAPATPVAVETPAPVVVPPTPAPAPVVEASVPAPAPKPAAATPARSVDLNSCTADQLTASGCPRLLADAIVRYRTNEGSFRRLEDLLKVPGITKAAYALLTGHEVTTEDILGTVNEVLGFPAGQEVSLKDITERIACWPDISGCVLGQASGLPLVGKVPAGIEKSAVMAFVPRLLTELNASFKEFSGRETNELVIPTKGTSYHIFRNDNLYLVILSRRRQLPRRYTKVARYVLSSIDASRHQ